MDVNPLVERPDRLAPLSIEELAELPARMRAYAGASATFDAGLYQLLMRGALWLERARPLLEREARRPSFLARFLRR